MENNSQICCEGYKNLKFILKQGKIKMLHNDDPVAYIINICFSVRKYMYRLLGCMYYSTLNLLLWRSLSYRNQSIDLQSRSMDWFLYDRELRHERVK